MQEQKPIPVEIQYAAPNVPSTRASNYSIASVVVSAASVAWHIVPVFVPVSSTFEAEKSDRGGMLIGVVGIVLAINGYQQPHRKRGLAYVGSLVGVVGLLFNLLCPTMM